MFKCKIIYVAACLLPFTVFAQDYNAEHEMLNQKYSSQGDYAAQNLKKKFELSDKSAFRKAYDDYLKDMETISETGKAPDNQNLYNELLEMKSDETFVYKEKIGNQIDIEDILNNSIR